MFSILRGKAPPQRCERTPPMWTLGALQEECLAQHSHRPQEAASQEGRGSYVRDPSQTKRQWQVGP